MSDESGKSKKLSLSGNKLTLGGVDAGQMRAGATGGGRRTVQVEVRRKRAPAAPHRTPAAPQAEPAPPPQAAPAQSAPSSVEADDKLTAQERAARVRALQEGLKKPDADAAAGDAAAASYADMPAADVASIDGAVQADAAADAAADAETKTELETPAAPLDPAEARRAAELAELREIEAEEERRRGEESRKLSEANARRNTPETAAPAARPANDTASEPFGRRRRQAEEVQARRPAGPRRDGPGRRQSGKMTITQALSGDEQRRQRSLASVRRQREKARMRDEQPQAKQVRDVIIPDTISVTELANRMAERTADVVKELMKLGVMATATQTVDGETAELIAQELGHRAQRVSESDVESGLEGADDEDGSLKSRPPVVTVMGHVDHGKTSLLDAIRRTDVATGESGGITQHIGAYQVELETGDHVTFLDTPGHAAFTAMRARGAQVTDIVVLVVAADDGVMPQTVEAINHAKAAGVPIVVAINKIDKPGVNPERVRNELLQHELVLEELGGDVIAVEVSAKTGKNLDKLLEAILLQAEVLELRANTDRAAQGAVVEAKLDKGRGPVATVLVQKGTLKTGDAFVVGSQWGRVRALIDDKGRKVEEAGPSVPVEILGLQGVPQAGDELVVVEDERKAREISAFRSEREQRARAATALGARGTVEQMLSEISAGSKKELAVLVKADVQGSLEAITATLAKLGNDEVAVRMLHGAVGGINESDITLAQASNALIIGFNVRANAQARDLARQAGLELRYYSVIYDLTNDVKSMLEGMLSPIRRETITGQAEIREVFAITKVGKIAGCSVTEGYVRRDSKVRLLRDDVVIHEGSLSSLKRFKDDVREVRAGQECGMAFENYQDLRAGDVIEAYEVEEIAAELKSPV